MSRSAPRTLLVTRNLPPLLGGAERLLFHVFLRLSSEEPCDVVGPAGCQEWVRAPNRAYPCRLAPALWFLFVSLWTAVLLCARRPYSLIVAGSALTAVHAVAAGALRRSPTLTLVHGLDVLAPNALYRRVVAWSLRRCHLVVANSRHTASLLRSLRVSEERIAVLHPGTDLPERPSDRRTFERAFGIEAGRRLLLFVGRLVPRKGLAPFLEQCLPEIVRHHPDTLLLVIGESPAMALSRQTDDLGELRALVTRLGLERHVVFAGRVLEDDLQAAYHHAEIHVMPARDVAGDVEGFGMVAIEAAAHGTPTVAFGVGGIAESVAHGRSGLVVAPGDQRAMIDAIKQGFELPGSLPTAESCRRFAADFSWSAFDEKLSLLCNQARGE